MARTEDRLAPEDAAEISAFIDKIGDYFDIQPMDEDSAVKAGLLVYIAKRWWRDITEW